VATYLGDTSVTKVYVGSSLIKSVYVGNTLVLSSASFDANLPVTVVSTATVSGTTRHFVSATLGITASTNANIASRSNYFASASLAATATRDTSISGFSRPTISSVSPTSGKSGATVTVTGTNFISGSTTVTIGGQAVSATVASATSLTFVVPATGLTNNTAYSVVATTSGGSGTGSFTYYANPTYSSISPTTGTTGTSVTIAGTNFISGGTSVTIGGTAATSVSATATSITCVVPTLTTAGAKDVVITTTAGAVTGTGAFSYSLAPAYTSISPTSGLAGSAVTITGKNFTGTTSVTVGGVAVSFTVVSATSITATIPATLAAGAATIVITSPNGSATITSAFTVTRPVPTYSSINIPQGLVGIVVTVTGTNFIVGETTATVGGIAATCSVTSTTTANITIPNIVSGVKSIVLTTPGGSATGTNVFTLYPVTTGVRTSYTTAGSGSYPIPAWCNKIDVVGVGGGGGGGMGSVFSWGQGGDGGNRNYATLVRGVDIAWSTTALAYTVGAGGIGTTQLGTGLPHFTQPGGNGGNSSVQGDPGTAPGIATGGGGGSSESSPTNNNGMTFASALTLNGQTYPGNTFGGNGNSTNGTGPGYGGGGGNSALGPFVGKNGGAGAVYFYAYQ
jgi:hypothetical protein